MVVVRVAVLAALLCALSAAPSAAIMVKLPNGRYANYDAMGGSKAPQAAKIFDAVFTNLDYSGGPVMPSNTNYIVEWQPSNYGSHTPFQTNYISGVNTFFSDMAHDSGLSTNSDAVSTQYNDVFGNTSAYSFTNGGVLVDNDPLPSNGCPAATGDICITDAQIQNELNHFLSGHVHDLAHEYYLLTPPDVASCFDSAGSQCSGNADLNQAYCAYHSETTGGFVYSNIPDLTGLYGCDPFVTFCPNFNCFYNNGPADGVLSAISHEHNESITDPQPNNAWTDWGSSVGGEIGDKCNNDAMNDPNVVLQDDGAGNDTPYNETINGDHYLIQREWSNQTASCLDSFTPNGTAAHAAFTATPGSGTAVSFNAGASTATGGVKEYVWQFNDGPGQTGTIETTSATISHTFPTAGTYDVALTVMASDGTSNGTANNVTAGGSSAPTAVFTAPTGLEGTSLTFDGSSSTGSITSYSWTFGDGTTGTGAIVHHTYAKYGNYSAKLTVTGSGGSSSVTHTVVVTDESPTAAFTFSPGSPSAGTAVAFDGTSSSDPDGSVSSYSWNFGDGSATATGAKPSHAYTAAGTYTVTLKITDSDGQTNTTSKTVTVSPAAPPTAVFTPPTGLEGTSLTFDGSSSTGTITTYTWDFGDGSPTATGAIVHHTYAKYGSYTAKLTVNSGSGTNTASHTVVVTDETPTAAFTFSPGSPRAGSSVSFDGTSSNDPDGSVAAYHWTFGDGGAATVPNPSHTYSAGGTYTVTLSITDSDGQVNTTSHTVTVAPPFQSPTAAFSAPSSALEGQAVTFDGSGSSDPPTNGGSLRYSWSFSDGGTGSGATVAHGFAAGVYVVTLTVTDSASGLTNSVSHTITIADENPTVSLSAASGTAGAPVAFSATGSDPDGAIASFHWNFGDGGTASGANPTHVYAAAGTYTVTVTVTDSAGRTVSASESVNIIKPTHGLPNCVVPKLKGKTLGAAKKLLKAAHCRLGSVKTPRKPKRSAGKHHKWQLVVAHQSVPPGRSEPNETKISLKLAYVAVKTH